MDWSWLGWLADLRWPEILTAAATMASAAFLYFQRRDRLRAEQPFVECSVSEDQPPGWARLHVVVRNFHPHGIAVRELRLCRPRRGVLYTEQEALAPPFGGHRKFIATTDEPKRQASFKADLRPSGAQPGYLVGNVKSHEGDSVAHTFYFSVPDGGKGIRLKINLICEVRSRVVRQHTIAIKRTIKLSSTSSAG